MASYAKFDEWYSTAGVAKQSIVQVVHSIIVEPFISSVNSEKGGVPIPGLTTSITPTTANSRIMIIADGVANGNSGYAQIYFWLARGYERIGAAVTPESARTPLGSRTYYSNNAIANPFILHYTDTPKTTSTITYNLFVGGQAGYNVYVGRTPAHPDDYYDGGRCSTRLTLLEITA